MKWVLSRKTLSDQRRTYLSWGMGIVAICAVQLWVYPTIKEASAGIAQLIDSYPDALKAIFRMQDYTSGPGYLGTELFSLMLPLIMIAVGAATGARTTAQEEEDSTADVLLALPISRTNIVLSKLVANLIAIIFLGIICFMTIWVGARFADLHVTYTQLLSGVIACVGLGIFFNALATMTGARSGKRGYSLGIAMAVAIGTYVIYSLAPLVKSFEHITPVLPIQWAIGNQPLFNGLDFGGLAKLGLSSAAFYAASLYFYERHDVRS